MRLPKLLKISHPAVILVFGMLVAQIIASIQVYLSNLDLHHRLLLVNSAGYLAIPNGRVMAGLSDFAPAFLGGLFFSFTIGAGITLGSMAASWIWVRVFGRKRAALHIFQLFWLGLAVSVNSRGFSLMSTLYLLLIPPAVFKLTAAREADFDNRSDRRRLMVHLIPIPLLALLWFTQFDNQMFLDLRDNLLLSNFCGRKFSSFYYTYTLYPAEAFKAQDQKIIKTSGFRQINDPAIQSRLARKLLNNDYLLLSDAAAADMVVQQKDGKIVLKAGARRILETTLNRFLSDTGSILKNFSEKTDRHAVFRQLTFVSILIAFPVSIYIFLHAAFYYPGYFIMGRKAASLTASIFCLLMGIIVLVYFQSNRSGRIGIENAAEALRSDRWQTRVAALKMIQNKKLDIADYAEYPHLINSPIPQERYWLAKSLAYSRQPGTFEDLLKLLDDKSMNVRTMALYSLGLRKDPRAVGPILEKIETFENWYCQLYAYRALRSIGWKQTTSH